MKFQPLSKRGLRMICVPSMTADSLTAYRIDGGSEIWGNYADGPVRLAPATLWVPIVQGKKLARRFDIADAAGGSLRAVTRAFAGIPMADSVRRTDSGGRNPPSPRDQRY